MGTSQILCITRAYCPICGSIGVLVAAPASLTEPLLCNAGHRMIVPVPGRDCFPHLGDEALDNAKKVE